MVEIKCQDSRKSYQSVFFTMSGFGEFSRVESNEAANSTPGGAVRHFSQVSACDHTPPGTQKL